MKFNRIARRFEFWNEILFPFAFYFFNSVRKNLNSHERPQKDRNRGCQTCNVEVNELFSFDE